MNDNQIKFSILKNISCIIFIINVIIIYIFLSYKFNNMEDVSSLYF